MILEIIKKEIFDGINIINIPAKHYKTNIINIYIKRPLNRDEVTKNSLIPYVLNEGSFNFNTKKIIDQELQMLYGSGFGINISKVGEMQILSFKISFTNEKYLEENIQERIINLLFDIVFNPFVVDNAFDSKKVRIQKSVLKEVLLSRINNKSLYAMDRAIQHMCAEEDYRISEDGFIEDIEKIDEKNLYEHYKRIVFDSEIDIAITGEVDSNLITNKLKEIFSSDRKVKKIQNKYEVYKDKPVKEIKEKLEVSQAKLVMGYRTNVSYDSELLVPLMLYNTILGGSANSKLFINVREKNSLAYSIGTILEKLKGILFIQAGIETDDYLKAKKLILEQIDDMQKGNITSDEILKAKKVLINAIKSVNDSVFSVADYIYTLSLQGSIFTPETMMERIRNVTLEEIIEVSKCIKLDTIFLLRSNKE